MDNKLEKAARLVEKGTSLNYVAQKMRLNRGTLQNYMTKENIKPGPVQQLRSRVILLNNQGLAVPCIAQLTSLGRDYIEHIIKSMNRDTTSIARYKDYTGDSRDDVYYRGKIPELTEADKREIDKIRQDVLGAKMYDNADYHVVDVYNETV